MRACRKPAAEGETSCHRAARNEWDRAHMAKAAARELLAPMPDVPENTVLSNRDKAEHSRQRGQDSKWIQTEQLQNHEANSSRRGLNPHARRKAKLKPQL